MLTRLDNAPSFSLCRGTVGKEWTVKNGTAYNTVISLQDQNVIKFIKIHNLFPTVSMTS